VLLCATKASVSLRQKVDKVVEQKVARFKVSGVALQLGVSTVSLEQRQCLAPYGLQGRGCFLNYNKGVAEKR